MDRNDTKSTSSPVIGATPERAAAGSHHQLLRDRLTKEPAPGAVAPAPSAACSHNQPGVPEPAAASEARERRRMPRRRMLKGGVMSFNGPFSGLQCTVRDLSEAGDA